jgi:protoporphyrinogen oxidase
MSGGAFRKVKYLILGAGPTGLGAAYRLNELGQSDFLLIDQANQPGGLAASYVDEHGFTWDTGGHVQFSHYSYFDALMVKALGSDGWLHHQRESWVWIKNRFLPYPFQNNIRYLPRESMWKCLEGIIKNYSTPRNGKPKNFEEWILATFGIGIAEEFMVPYNYKVWAYHPRELSYQWIGERVATTDLRRVTENIVFEKDDLSWGPNNTFQFPKYGGTGAVWISVAGMLPPDRIILNTSVCAVDPSTKRVELSDGSTVEFEHLLSTIPLDILTTLTSALDSRIVERAAELKHSNVHVVGVGLRGKPKPDLKTKCWMYFPEDNCPFYRTTVFSNYSPNNVPDINTHWSLMTETSESPDKKVSRSAIIEETIQGLLNTDLIQSRNDIVSTWHFAAEYGYPTPSLERDAILKDVLPALERYGIYSRGRFGAWKYEVSNQDHSLMQGVEWANRMVLEIPEVTVFYPEVANANWGKR